MRRSLGSTVDVGVFGFSVGRPTGVPAPQQFWGERDPGER